MGFLAGKRALIVGLASERSIAHGIAAAMHREGAELAFTYQNDRLKDRVVEMASAFGSKATLPMDVASDAEIDTAFAAIREVWGSLDILVHSVAFAPREELAGTFVESSTRDGFRIAHEISSYSLTALARAARPLMTQEGGGGGGGAIVTLSYLGAVRSIPNYNVMGLAKASLEANVRFLAADLGPQNIRVNAISAGPIKTLAASGVSGFREPGPGWCRMCHCEPSVWRWIDSTPRFTSSVGSSTSAPAPSPKRMQVLRSFQSRMRVSVSAPTTSAFLARPVETYRSAIESA